jgi:adenosylcobinamide-GDP ribazoletransferase
VSVLADGLRVAVGTLTVVPVPPPRAVGPSVAAVGMTLAPLAAFPVAATGAAAVYVGDALSLPPLLTATVAVAALALATGALHLDGLADTADGLVTPGDRDRRLEVMRRGDIGPAGVAVLVFVLLTQVGALAGVLGARGASTAAVTLVLAVVVSRATLPMACVRGLPAARPDGLGTGVAGTVPLTAVVVVGLVVAATAGALHGTRGVAGVLAAAAAVGLLLLRAQRAIGGVTGDVLGACVEVALAAYLLAEVADPAVGP